MEEIKPFIIPEKWRFIELKNKEEFIPDFKISKVLIDGIVILMFNKKNSNDFYIYGGYDINKLLIPKPVYSNIYDSKTNQIKPIVQQSHNTLKISSNYCFEITNYLQGGIINYISTNPDLGCNFSNHDCKGLNYIMNIIFKVLNLINYDKYLYLIDDSQVQGFSLLLFNLISGKDSVYCKYGFEYTYDSIMTIEKNKEIIEELKKFLKDKGWKGKVIDKDFLQLFADFGKQFYLQNILMLNEEFSKDQKLKTNCKFNQKCKWTLFEREEELTQEIELPTEIKLEGYQEDVLSLPMSLDIIEDIPELPKKNDRDVINEWLGDVKDYIDKGHIFNEDLAEILLPLDINFNLIDYSDRKVIVKLFNNLLNYYGLYLTSKPIKIEDLYEEKKWIKVESDDYSLISRILVFLILSGLRRLSYQFLVKLLELYKKSEEKISFSQFRKWNEIVGTY